jgi:hypothetical protein
VTGHGRAETYRRERCRCAPCRYAASAARRAQQPLRDPGPVQAHLHALSAAGIGYRRAAALAGVAENTVYQILTLSRRPMARTAERLLAVSPDAGPAERLPDATGSRRRLQALQAIGWTVREVSEVTGHNEPMLVQIVGGKQRVAPATVASIAAVYDRLHLTQAPDSTPALRARRRALRRCWFPPFAWDVETIDSPDAVPCLLPPAEPVNAALELLVQHIVAGHPVRATTDAVKEIVRRMPDRKPMEIAAIVGCDRKFISHLKTRLEAAA